MHKGGAEATSTSVEMRGAGPKSTSIASRVGLRLGGWGVQMYRFRKVGF